MRLWTCVHVHVTCGIVRDWDLRLRFEPSIVGRAGGNDEHAGGVQTGRVGIPSCIVEYPMRAVLALACLVTDQFGTLLSIVHICLGTRHRNI